MLSLKTCSPICMPYRKFVFVNLRSIYLLYTTQDSNQTAYHHEHYLPLSTYQLDTLEATLRNTSLAWNENINHQKSNIIPSKSHIPTNQSFINLRRGNIIRRAQLPSHTRNHLLQLSKVSKHIQPSCYHNSQTSFGATKPYPHRNTSFRLLTSNTLTSPPTTYQKCLPGFIIKLAA